MTTESSPSAVFTVDQAREAVLAAIVAPLKFETIDLASALGRVCAADIIARLDIPPFQNSAMDGYAIRYQDYLNSNRFTICGTSLAGHPYTGKVGQNCAVRITTGARVAPATDTIVILENATVDGDQIIVNQQPDKQQYIRNPGDDTSTGSLLIAKNKRLAAADLGLMAAQGISTVKVIQKPSIGVFSTGDELCENTAQLDSGKIYDSNRITIQALLSNAGFESTDLGIAWDSKQSIQTILDKATDHDFVLSSGGVSVGEADFVKSVLESNGELLFWKVAMKPGKPMVTGRLNSGAYYFGLPGNPVSSMVSCMQFVIPAIQAWCGQKYKSPIRLTAICDSDLSKEYGRFEFQRGFASQTKGSLRVTTTGLQDSHVLTSMSHANCFIYLESTSTGQKAGSTVDIVMFDSFTGR